VTRPDASPLRRYAALALCCVFGVYGGARGAYALYAAAAEATVRVPPSEPDAKGPFELKKIGGIDARLYALNPTCARLATRALAPLRGRLFETLEATSQDAIFVVASDYDGGHEAQILMTRLFPRRCVVAAKTDRGWREFVLSIDDAKGLRVFARADADDPVFVVDFGRTAGEFRDHVATPIFREPFVSAWSVR
jgi:hypothetical protein